MSSLAPVIDYQFRFPMELYGVIYSFLQGKDEDPRGDVDIIRTSEVCKAWRKDDPLQRMRDQASKHLLAIKFILNEYPTPLRQLSKRCNLSIIALPELDTHSLRARIPYTDDTVNFIDPTDMPNSLMRFQDGRRPGIALHLRAIDPQTGLPINRVLTIYKRIQRIPNVTESIDYVWIYAWSQDQRDIQTLISNHHNQTEHTAGPGALCPTCPFASDQLFEAKDFPFLSRVLSNQHPVCSLPGHVVQPLAPASNRNYVRTVFITSFAIAALAYLINYSLN